MGDVKSDFLTLQEVLEAEFCPPLDTTLIAAFLTDQAPGGIPSDATLHILREQLAILAASATADQDDLAFELHDLQLQSASTEDSRDIDSIFDRSSRGTGSGSDSSAPPLNVEMTSATKLKSALAFLQTSFPHLSEKKLKEKLCDAESFGTLDMETIVEELLNEDFVREFQERGIEEDEALNSNEWNVVAKKPQRARTNTSPNTHSVLGNKKRKTKPTTVAINDIRQKHHIRPKSQISGAGDPWSQVDSISTYLQSLLPRPSSFFQSYFHKPEFATPAQALRAALRTISKQGKEKQSSGENKDQATALFSLVEYIRASPDYGFDDLNPEACDQLFADVELSLAATDDSPDAALDIIKLLQEMEYDKDRSQEMGIYHSPASPLTYSVSSPNIGSTLRRPSDAKSSAWKNTATPTLTPPSSIRKDRPPPAPNQETWHQVPVRPKVSTVNPLAVFIPAYNPQNVPQRKRRSAPLHPTSSSLETVNGGWSRSALGGFKKQIDACRARRDEALRTACRHWARGGARGRGGEVALFYAMEAQRHQEEQRRLQLDAARELVDGKRYASSQTDTIDVHYCTSAEALSIVREVLSEGWASATRPLHIITGRGMHSSGGIAVLGPVVKNTLERQGWAIEKFDGGLSVRGHSKR